jgi:hypothetical protein
MGGSASAAKAQSEVQSLSPPLVDGEPVEVYVELFNVNINSIDERDETFEIDAFLYADWFDERQAFDMAEGLEQKVFQGEAAVEILKTSVWWPDFEIVDARGPRERLQTTLTIDYDGFVTYTERFRAYIVQPFFLEDFPFDEHTISLTIQPFYHTGDEVVFLDDDERSVGEDLSWESNEWEIGTPRTYIETGENPDESLFAISTLEIDISRISQFYLSNFIIPLILIVAISWAVFWMDFENMHLADRLSVSFTSVLTVVAFDFVTSDNLPRLPYPTLMDSFLTVSYFVLAITVLENVIVYSISKEDPNRAQRLERIARIALPVVYFAVLLLLFLL